MSTALAAEVERINASLYRITRKGEFAQEVPLRIHTHDTDAGHGLGGPAFSRAFTTWIGQICTCNRKKDPYDPDDYGCSATPTRFLRGSDHRQHQQRLKRALRKLRAIAPAEHDALYLMLALGYSFDAARDKINEGRLRRLQPEYSNTDFMVLAVAGASKLIESY